MAAVLTGCAAPAIHPPPTNRTGTAGTPASAPLTSAPAPPPSPAAGTPRPPLLVAVSFDGADDVGLWRYRRGVARRDHANLTFLLSGVYLLSAADARLYHPPRRPAGSSDIGFVASDPGVDDHHYIAELLHEIAAGRAEGDELGTHYNGHFCGRFGVMSWTADDWRAELDAFDDLLERALAHNHLSPAGSAPPPPAGSVLGGRTPCLEGDPSVLCPVLRERGFRYDASASAPEGEWPQRVDGIWSLPLGIVHRAGTPYRNVAMDHSFYVNQPSAVEAPASLSGVLEEQTYRSYMEYFRDGYLGDRAPLGIGHHFTSWNHGAYVRALTPPLRGRAAHRRGRRAGTASPHGRRRRRAHPGSRGGRGCADGGSGHRSRCTPATPAGQPGRRPEAATWFARHRVARPRRARRPAIAGRR